MEKKIKKLDLSVDNKKHRLNRGTSQQNHPLIPRQQPKQNKFFRQATLSKGSFNFHPKSASRRSQRRSQRRPQRAG